LAGLRGLPRRVYSAALDGEQAARWGSLPEVAALGGAILFLSALAFVLVVCGTWLAGKRIAPPAFELALPLRPVTSRCIWDPLGLWSTVAVVLIVVAYAWPITQLLAHPRFGSPPFKPF